MKEANAGNFFFWGHGYIDNIAGNFNQARIMAGDVENALMNKAHRATPRVPRSNQHPYRLTVLNACNTYSAEWANAFGVDFAPGGTHDTTVGYRSVGRTPRAFVGWVQMIDVPNRFGSWIGYEAEYAEGLGQLFFNWMEGNFLSYDMNQYAIKMAYHSFGGHSSWKISGCQNMTRFD